MTTPVDEATLIARMQAGDKSACALCIERYGDRIYRLALRLMKNEADAEDVVQETFISAFKAMESFEGRAQLGTWLYRIAYNSAMMRLRKSRPPTLPVEQALRPDERPYLVPEQLYDWCCLPERDLEKVEVRQALEEAIDELTPALRATFVLRELEGLSTEETAEALDISTDATKKRLQRARMQLREALSNYFATSSATPT
jgi:RNA polymerase sigma-70 factor (ECF subfamily)